VPCGGESHRLTPALTGNYRDAARRKRASIGSEIAIASIILAITAVLTLTPPPRIAGPRQTAVSPVHGMAASEPPSDLMAMIDIAPGRPGPNRIAVMLHRPSAATPPVPKEVWLELSEAATGIGPIRRRLLPRAGGFIYDGTELAIPGRWTVRIEALLTDYDQVIFATEVDIR
jgi:copper transport protein